MEINEQFLVITGYRFPYRESNLLVDRFERKDQLFGFLARLYFTEPRRFRALGKQVVRWLRKDTNERLYALAGYIAYIDNDFERAQRLFYRAIQCNPENLDNWIDFAFALRHNGDYKTSNGILFNYAFVMYNYMVFDMQDASVKEIKKLINEISRRENDNQKRLL